MPHISFKIKAESISTFGTNGLKITKNISNQQKKISAFYFINFEEKCRNDLLFDIH